MVQNTRAVLCRTIHTFAVTSCVALFPVVVVVVVVVVVDAIISTICAARSGDVVAAWAPIGREDRQPGDINTSTFV